MRRRTIISFVLIEAWLYIIFIGMDLLDHSAMTIILKYSGILLCLLFTVLCAAKGGEKTVTFALLFTATADFFLLVLNDFYMAGLVFFLAAQMIYLIRLYKGPGKIWLPVRILCAILAVLLPAAVNMWSLLNLTALVYFSLLLINMAVSWSCKDRKWRIFALGLSLFVLCDLCVGAFNLSGFVPDGLYRFARIGMWVFYLPSQVLISLSCLFGEAQRRAPGR